MTEEEHVFFHNLIEDFKKRNKKEIDPTVIFMLQTALILVEYFESPKVENPRELLYAFLKQYIGWDYKKQENEMKKKLKELSSSPIVQGLKNFHSFQKVKL